MYTGCWLVIWVYLCRAKSVVAGAAREARVWKIRRRHSPTTTWYRSKSTYHKTTRRGGSILRTSGIILEAWFWGCGAQPDDGERMKRGTRGRHDIMGFMLCCRWIWEREKLNGICGWHETTEMVENWCT